MVTAEPDKCLRILLETDAPYIVPANLYEIPWTAAFVADVAGEGWNTDKFMADSRENARNMYDV